MNNQITSFQSLIEKQIKILEGDEDAVDKIIQAYITECVNKILNNMESFNKTKEYEKEKRKLIISLGEDAWNKLSLKSKTFLITSKLIYNESIMLD